MSDWEKQVGEAKRREREREKRPEAEAAEQRRRATEPTTATPIPLSRRSLRRSPMPLRLTRLLPSVKFLSRNIHRVAPTSPRTQKKWFTVLDDFRNWLIEWA